MRPAVPEGDCDGKHRTRMLLVATVLTLQIQTIKIDNEHPGEDSCSPTDQVAKMSSDEKAALQSQLRNHCSVWQPCRSLETENCGV
jgi:hypothetical protein